MYASYIFHVINESWPQIMFLNLNYFFTKVTQMPSLEQALEIATGVPRVEKILRQAIVV